MIPKIIHYCWFGGNPLPKKYRYYIATWKKYCPNYQIHEWNETNFDVDQNLYCKEAYKAKKWAFVSDYARLKIIYDNGGIYLDTDIEMIQDLFPLISKEYGFIGFQNSEEINTGLGFAAVAHNSCIKSMLDIYNYIKFSSNSEEMNLIPCPAINTVGLIKCGLHTGETFSHKIQTLEGLKVYPVEYFCPMNYDTQKLKITSHSYTIHRFSSSWFSSKNKSKKIVKKLLPDCFLKYRANKISQKNIKKIMLQLKHHT